MSSLCGAAATSTVGRRRRCGRYGKNESIQHRFASGRHRYVIQSSRIESCSQEPETSIGSCSVDELPRHVFILQLSSAFCRFITTPVWPGWTVATNCWITSGRLAPAPSLRESNTSLHVIQISEFNYCRTSIITVTVRNSCQIFCKISVGTCTHRILWSDNIHNSVYIIV